MIQTSWYIARNKQRFGPFNSKQLQQLALLGLVKPTEFILPEGGNKWVVAAAIDGLFPATEQHKKYWLSVGGKPQGPHRLEQIGIALLGRKLSTDTLACLEGGREWTALGRLDDFQDYIPSASRDSQAHLGAGSSHLDLNKEEAELHLAGKRGDLLARLMSVLFDLKRKHRDNPSLVEIINKNLIDLKAIRERGALEEKY
jgi:hypothetical protein